MVSRILQAVDSLAPELLRFAQDLIAIPTVNPPGEHYAACAGEISARLTSLGFETSTLAHHNVIATLRGASPRPMVHFNGHIDVVPPGEGWTRPPFQTSIEDGKLYGRGSSDMKAGLAAAIYAAAALRCAEIPLAGSLQISATVDEETGGFAGVGHLAREGLLTSRSIDYVIIPEPFGPARISIGHRGVYWFRIVSHGKIAHGSMPYLGVSAIENMSALLEELRCALGPEMASRMTAMPVVPERSRFGTFNVNSIHGGQPDDNPQSPCVADRCEAVLDRRYLAEDGEGEEGARRIREQIEDVMARVMRRLPESRFDLEDYGNTVYPTSTPPDCELVSVLSRTVREVTGSEPELVASPGTYDHKHFRHIGGIVQCVAYGPGELEQAHQPDEWCRVEDIIQSCKVMAITAARLIGG